MSNIPLLGRDKNAGSATQILMEPIICDLVRAGVLTPEQGFNTIYRGELPRVFGVVNDRQAMSKEMYEAIRKALVDKLGQASIDGKSQDDILDLLNTILGIALEPVSFSEVPE